MSTLIEFIIKIYVCFIIAFTIAAMIMLLFVTLVCPGLARAIAATAPPKQ